MKTNQATQTVPREIQLYPNISTSKKRLLNDKKI